MPPTLRLALAGLSIVAASHHAVASGSYPPNPPRLGGAALAQIDARAYNLGKSIFTSRLTLPATTVAVDSAANRTRLAAAQSVLPDRVRSEIDLPALAERLDAAQVDALLYYIGIRFRVTVPASA
ncbi:MAG: hypothetical protein MUE42_15495 [Opitutaceae bacterium]|nr:hypothetical protein [Opitutaceae bacterium]